MSQELAQPPGLSVIAEEEELDESVQLSSMLPEPIMPPEMCSCSDGTYILLRRAYVENIVFPGCAALNATLTAAGIAPEMLDRLLEETPWQDLKKDVPNFKFMYPSELVALHPEKPGPTWLNKMSYWIRQVLLKLFVGGSSNSAQKALQLIDQWSAEEVINYAKKECFIVSADGSLELEPTLRAKLSEQRAALSEEAQAKLDRQIARLKGFAQQSKQDFQKDRTNKMVTFDDLAFLQQLAPAKFKELIVAGLDKAANKTIYFNAADYPDMPIAIFAYISIALPMHIQSADYKYLGKEKHIYTDGELINKVPAEEFLRGESKESVVRARTIVLDFLDSGALYPLLRQSPSREDKSLKVKVLGWLYNVQGKAADRQKLYEAGENVYALNNSSLRLLAFDIFLRQFASLQKPAADARQEQLVIRAQEASTMSVKNPQQAFNLLSAEEREARRIAGPSIPPAKRLQLFNPAQYNFAKESFEATKALYQLCEAAYQSGSNSESEQMQPQNLISAVASWA